MRIASGLIWSMQTGCANMSAKRPPMVLAIAGPNGSGKTTVAGAIAVCGTYVNADDLQREYGLTALGAARQAEALRNHLLDRKLDFTFETVLSTDRNLLLLQRAKTLGYTVQCIYVLTCDENINVARVRARHIAGGHNVPEDKIRSRYHKALALLPSLVPVCDKILVYDNSDTPSLIFCRDGTQTGLFPNEHWSETDLQKLFALTS